VSDDRRQAYKDAVAAVREVVNKFDPMGLLKIGAPEDEYDPEVAGLVRLVMRRETFDDQAVAAVWQRWFGDQHGVDGSALAAQTGDLQALQARFGAAQ
jgi:hypothetical protein